MKNKVIKSLISPLQKVLLQKRLCPACTRSLSKGKELGENEFGKIIVCECGRVFVYESETASYRRALHTDLEKIN